MHLPTLVTALRPKQWIKSSVVFAALVFDGRLFEPSDFIRVAGAAIIFTMVSSAGYLFNDLRDRDADRRHPEKRKRPIASGTVSPFQAAVAMAVLYTLAIPAAFALSNWFAVVVVIYAFLMFVYSIILKHFVIVDVLVISAGFVLRAVAGAAVISVPISPWLYVCTILLALFLAFAKRRHELALLEFDAAGHRPNLNDYSLALLDQLILIVSATVVMAYSLYTFESEALEGNQLMMLTIPFVLYGIFRYLYLVHQKGEGGAPEHVVLSDRPMLMTVVLWGIASVLILYGPWN